MMVMRDTFYDLYCEEVKKNEKLTKELNRLKEYNKGLSKEIAHLVKDQDKIVSEKVDKEIGKVTQAFEDKMISLQKQVEQLRSVLNNDSTNSGIPTSQTAINKTKRIPNSREKSGKKKGGQIGHKKSSLSKFEECEITDTIEHKIEICPDCGTRMTETGKCRTKDETDFEVVVKKIRHKFYEQTCPKCGNVIQTPIPTQLKEENQYGQGVQALALTMMNEGFVSMNRTKEIIEGLTDGQISPSEGYIAKLQKRLAKKLSMFDGELKKEIIQQKLIHWDDTVIMISTNRACLRFYGNEALAYYTAHSKKDKEGVDKDGILAALDKDTLVVHDHNKLNYNDDYVFTNVECCTHLLRDLKKVVDNLGHEWPKEMIELLLRENHRRKEGLYIDAEGVKLSYRRIIAGGGVENIEENSDRYYVDTEATLLKRLKEYETEYLMWTLNKDIPFTNNEAERSLRGSKTKMKVSGQFENLVSAQNYATIKSYLETGHRHGYNSIYLINRALEDNYVTIEEMKRHDEEYF